MSTSKGFHWQHKINPARRYKSVSRKWHRLVCCEYRTEQSAMEMHIYFPHMLGRKSKEAKVNQTCCA